MKNKVKTYKIKIPAYTTEVFPINKVRKTIPMTYADIVDLVKVRISNFDTSRAPKSFGYTGKSKETVIKSLQCHIDESDDKKILIQVSAYNTNLNDGYFEGTAKVQLEKNHKIGTDTFFFMVYPVIKGLGGDDDYFYYHILIYEDPNKNHEELIKLVKHVVTNILKFGLKNIKGAGILEDLKDIISIQELQMKYSSLRQDRNSIDVKFKEYHTTSNLKKVMDSNFKDIPLSLARELIEEGPIEDYTRAEARFKHGRTEYRITKEQIEEASKELLETGEKIFNCSTELSESEVKEKLYDISFIFEKMTAVLHNLTSYDN